MADISTEAALRLASKLEKRDEHHLADQDSWNAADMIRAQAAQIDQLKSEGDRLELACLNQGKQITRLKEALDQLEKHTVKLREEADRRPLSSRDALDLSGPIMATLAVARHYAEGPEEWSEEIDAPREDQGPSEGPTL